MISRYRQRKSNQLGLEDYLGDLEALRVGLGEQRLTLVGHSLGMTYALAYAAAYPDYTRGVITLGSGIITADFNQAPDYREAERTYQLVPIMGSFSPDKKTQGSAP